MALDFAGMIVAAQVRDQGGVNIAVTPRLAGTAVNALRRLMVDLGLERAARDVTPPLSDYLKAKAREAG